MSEDEYIRVTNLCHIRTALTVLRNVLPGEGWGLTDEQKLAITKPLAEAGMRLEELADQEDEEG